MKRTSSVIIIALSVFVSAQAAYQEIYLGGARHEQSDYYPGLVETLDVGMMFYDVFPQMEGVIWNGITPQDAGSTFYKNAQTDPAFQIVAEHLTNGVFEEIWFPVSFPGQSQQYSMGFMYEDYFRGVPGEPIDLAGSIVTSLSLRVNSLTLNYVPAQNRTYYDFSFSYFAWGVPEPCTVLLLGLGSLIIRRNRIR